MAKSEAGTAPNRPEPSVQIARVPPAVVTDSGVAPRMWGLASLLTPVLLGGYLTFLSGVSEKRITANVDLRAQTLGSQLRVSEELFKRQMDAYDKLYSQLVALQGKLRYQATANSKQTADLLEELSQARAMNGLYMTEKVSVQMGAAWQDAVRGDENTLTNDIQAVEDQMKSELESKVQQTAENGQT
jgi:hypothetical protein